ncbi:carboxypeptidase S [Wolfiporia cocos MD-104 SS10]|uniref:Carboxypeptidase S n=1 Tax=Wolfiporia cocos (strain MD-104) TaxID=742152 RepID=A0A2H3JPX9_WOLCO|nr:carboxypeptidase S [Wolfiporia cocos MD-104 SS10]
MSSTKSEKGSLLPSAQPAQPVPETSQRRKYVTFAVLVLCAFLQLGQYIHGFWFRRAPEQQHFPPASAEHSSLCPQVAPLVPEKSTDLYSGLAETFETKEFLFRAVDLLAGAVRIPTQSYDDLGPIGEDPRWEAFAPFHEYLLKSYPQVHATLNLTKVNTYGLVYHWKGTNSTLKPLLLTGHQDVVPVNPETYDEWVHPPFSGYFDGQYVWGRGSRDDKSGLIGVMTGIELLLERGFRPARSVVLAFGFDEEVSGKRGASALGEYLYETYGKDSFAMIVDEGGKITESYGGVFAVPSVGEKGYIDVRFELAAPGGHSSVPPAHTTIGMLARLIVEYENNQIEAVLSRNTPTYWHAECLAAYAPDLPDSIKDSMKYAGGSDEALRAAQEELFKDPTFKALVGTTTAVDIVSGGVKSNALPENVMAIANHRIATDSSVEEVKKHSTAILKTLATEFNLSYTAFGTSVTGDEPGYGMLTLSDAWGTALNPAPVSPVDGEDAAPFKLLSGTIKSTYKAHRALEEDVIPVIPSLVSGNTDTRYYWNLTSHIFRYSHYHAGSGTGLNGVHTINEACNATNLVEMMRFFTTLILNADESPAL